MAKLITVWVSLFQQKKFYLNRNNWLTLLWKLNWLTRFYLQKKCTSKKLVLMHTIITLFKIPITSLSSTTDGLLRRILTTRICLVFNFGCHEVSQLLHPGGFIIVWNHGTTDNAQIATVSNVCNFNTMNRENISWDIRTISGIVWPQHHRHLKIFYNIKNRYRLIYEYVPHHCHQWPPNAVSIHPSRKT